MHGFVNNQWLCVNLIWRKNQFSKVLHTFLKGQNGEDKIKEGKKIKYYLDYMTPSF